MFSIEYCRRKTTALCKSRAYANQFLVEAAHGRYLNKQRGEKRSSWLKKHTEKPEIPERNASLQCLTVN